MVNCRGHGEEPVAANHDLGKVLNEVCTPLHSGEGHRVPWLPAFVPMHTWYWPIFCQVLLQISELSRSQRVHVAKGRGTDALRFKLVLECHSFFLFFLLLSPHVRQTSSSPVCPRQAFLFGLLKLKHHKSVCLHSFCWEQLQTVTTAATAMSTRCFILPFLL